MARKSLDEALGSSEPEPARRPPFAAELADAPRHPREPKGTAPEPEPDRYKLTAVLDEDDHRRLEWLTDRVLDEVQPRRVGKGWRTRVIRALLALAEDDPAMVRAVADEVRRQSET